MSRAPRGGPPAAAVPRALAPVVYARGRVWILDQRAIPDAVTWIGCASWREVRDAIRDMAVRGAPAIGIAAAYGMALAAREAEAGQAAGPSGEALARLEEAARALRAARPTAVQLERAVLRQLERARTAQAARGADGDGRPRRLFPVLVREARRTEREEAAASRRIAAWGAPLLPERARVYTHCHTGALAAGGEGTALAVIREAHRAGRLHKVWVGETRPRLQGARLTLWELQAAGVPAVLVADGAAGWLMAKGMVDCVLVGADRVARNGDVANKVGTLALAILASRFQLPFLVAAPLSTFDRSVATGEDIPIEERPAEELTHVQGVKVAPPGASAYNPAFDVTPAELVTAFVTERGVLRPPIAPAIARARGARGRPG
ncbi:MAG: S-methyl-5-thioribose-1-phosphate isomerase, partial [Clostridia bacterium]|nr:S-methyl-5-thioribose-1-phosphate isomerase [Clostridia bacterium]